MERSRRVTDAERVRSDEEGLGHDEWAARDGLTGEGRDGPATCGAHFTANLLNNTEKTAEILGSGDA